MIKETMNTNGHTAHEAIRIEAYLLSEQAGHPGGMEHTFWQQAETIVLNRAMSQPVEAKPPMKKATIARKPASTEKARAKAPSAGAAKKKSGTKAVQETLSLEEAPATKAPASAKKTRAPASKGKAAESSKAAALTKPRKTGK